MTKTIAIKNTENTKKNKLIDFPATSDERELNPNVIDFAAAKKELPKVIQMKAQKHEGNVIRFHVFMECFWSDRPDWKGRAFALLRDIKACLFWEETLLCRKQYDEGKLGGYNYQYQLLLAENDQEQCRSNFEMHLMKSIRAACALNAELRNNIGEFFITRKIKRSDEIGPYNFDMADSLKVIHDFDQSFDDNWGEGASLRDIRWDFRLKAHNAELAELAAA